MQSASGGRRPSELNHAAVLSAGLRLEDVPMPSHALIIVACADLPVACFQVHEENECKARDCAWYPHMTLCAETGSCLNLRCGALPMVPCGGLDSGCSRRHLVDSESASAITISNSAPPWVALGVSGERVPCDLRPSQEACAEDAGCKFDPATSLCHDARDTKSCFQYHSPAQCDLADGCTYNETTFQCHDEGGTPPNCSGFDTSFSVSTRGLAAILMGPAPRRRFCPTPDMLGCPCKLYSPCVPTSSSVKTTAASGSTSPTIAAWRTAVTTALSMAPRTAPSGPGRRRNRGHCSWPVQRLTMAAPPTSLNVQTASTWSVRLRDLTSATPGSTLPSLTLSAARAAPLPRRFASSLPPRYGPPQDCWQPQLRSREQDWGTVTAPDPAPCCRSYLHVPGGMPFQVRLAPERIRVYGLGVATAMRQALRRGGTSPASDGLQVWAPASLSASHGLRIPGPYFPASLAGLHGKPAPVRLASSVAVVHGQRPGPTLHSLPR